MWTATAVFTNTFIFSSLETFALQRKQTSEVKIFFGVSMALIKILSGFAAKSFARAPTPPATQASGVARVRECYILSTNFKF